MSSNVRTPNGHDDEISEEDKKRTSAPVVDGSLKRKRSTESLTIPIPSSSSAISASFPAWAAGSSPAKFVSIEELMGMSTAMENMALVHEIAVNPEFKVDLEPKTKLEKSVRDCMHRAFWDRLGEEVRKDPPDYSNAFDLLLEIKQMILDLLTPQHIRLRSEIDSHLDEALLRQQLEKGCLDFTSIFNYIVNLLSRLCAPARDEMVAKLREQTDLISMLRGTCELLDVMKVDMANFEVKLNRAAIEEHSATYERNLFMKLVDANPDLEIAITDWLKRHAEMIEEKEDVSEPVVKRRFEDLNNSEVNAIISDAYMELLEWDDSHPYPSTLKVDKHRLEALAEKYLQLIICTSCVLISCNLAGKDIAELPDFKQKLKNDVIVITNDIDKKNVNERLEAIFVQCDKEIAKRCDEIKCRKWRKECSDDLRSQILAVSSPKNHVRKLLRDRLRSFILSMIKGGGSVTPQRIPPGLSIISHELCAITSRFLRLVSHNRNTFGTFYGDLIKKAKSQ